jgi:hypothetical protein
MATTRHLRWYNPINRFETPRTMLANLRVLCAVPPHTVVEWTYNPRECNCPDCLVFMDWGLDEGLVVFDSKNRPVDIMLALRKQRESVVAWKAYLAESRAKLAIILADGGPEYERYYVLDRIAMLENKLAGEQADREQLERGNIPDSWMTTYF